MISDITNRKYRINHFKIFHFLVFRWQWLTQSQRARKTKKSSGKKTREIK